MRHARITHADSALAALYSARFTNMQGNGVAADCKYCSRRRQEEMQTRGGLARLKLRR